jgi:hypothetical protein
MVHRSFIGKFVSRTRNLSNNKVKLSPSVPLS